MTDIKTSNTILVEKLVDFGLSNSEARVYVTLLEYGKELGGSKLALLTHMPRQYIYIALPKLISQRLVEEIKKGKQAKYKARPPQVIETLGRRKAIEAGDLARELNQISNIGNEQEFEVLQGMRAIQQYERDLVTRADDTWECYIIGGASAGYSAIMGESLDEHLDEMRKKELSVKYLGSDDERPFYEEYIGKFANQEYRFLINLPKGVTHLVIRHDSVSFYTFLNPPLVYVIKSKQIADNYRAFFNMLWGMGKG